MLLAEEELRLALPRSERDVNDLDIPALAEGPQEDLDARGLRLDRDDARACVKKESCALADVRPRRDRLDAGTAGSARPSGVEPPDILEGCRNERSLTAH
jgi:hypothetical protein